MNAWYEHFYLPDMNTLFDKQINSLAPEAIWAILMI